MQSTNIPSKIPLPFAFSATGTYKNTIPVASQIGVTPGRASLTDGFPPLNFTPITAGGVPPFGGDMNGILNEITSIQQWQEAGGMFAFDSVFAATIGGYPKGAVLQSSSFNGLWISSIENNSNDPDVSGTGWTSLSFEGMQTVSMSGTSVTLTSLQAAYPVIKINGTLTANSTVILPNQVGEWIVINNTTGSFTLTVKTAAGSGVVVPQLASTFLFGDATSIYFADTAKVSSFNGRVGSITLTATDVTNALGYVPPTPTGGGASGTWNISITGSWSSMPAGTVTDFFQAAAPTGWTQITTYSNHMLRVVSGAGGGSGGTMSPILMNVVPSHTHSFTTGGESANHTHYDSGHIHGPSKGSNFVVNPRVTGSGGNLVDGGLNADYNGGNTATSYASLGTQSGGHVHSGSTDNGSSQTNWTPQYVNMILCSKN